MNENFDYDVIVVGGGPGGAIAAFTLAKAGYNVCILDKKKRERIGDKTCGDALDKATVDLLKKEIGIDEPQGDEVSDIISKMSIAANNIETKATLTAPGYVVDRLNYGQRLLKDCEEAGVTVISQAPVRDIIIENEFLKGVKFYHEGETKELRAKFTIDASGSYAAIRSRLPESMRFGNIIEKDLKPSMVWPTYREIIELNEEKTPHPWLGEIILLYEREIPIPGYFWIFSKGPNRLNVGLGWLKTEKNQPPLKKALRKELEKYYKEEDYRVIRSGGGQIPIRPPFDTLVFDGGALVGDAGCLVHPTTAEGHGPALESGFYCAKAMIKALEKEDYSHKAIWQYNLDIMHHLGEKHANALLIREFLEKVGADSLEFLLKKRFLTNDDLDKLVRGQAVQLSLGEKIKRLLRIFPIWSPVFHLVKLLRKSEEVRKHYLAYPKEPDHLEEWRKMRNSITGWGF